MSQAQKRSVRGGGLRRLVIVESPTKAKTIRRFLGPSYRVEASMGHVRDLPASAAEIPSSYKDQAWARLGINDRFEPIYIVPAKKKKVVSELRAALRDADELYIATDEDREGESIGWHLVEVLNPKVPVHRMVFHEITEDAILRALGETRAIDQHLVDAQETRRVLDRLVGYTLSPLLWKKVAPKLSAGRVQSVAVRLMVLRERERIAFVPASYWDLKARLEKNQYAFDAVMTHLGGVRLATGRDFDDDTGKLKAGLTAGKDILLLGQADAKGLADRLKSQAWHVHKVEERTGKRSPAAPFTTSTLQQEASRKLGLSAKETMRLAQGLYENGYITYMRTDSTNLASEAVNGARRAVETRYGKEYLSPSPRSYNKKAKNAQEAHEAIRPAGGDMKTQAEHGLAGLEGRLYDLIWKRTVATQMADAVLRFVTARIHVGEGKAQAEFRASGRTTVFAGFFRAYVEGSDDPNAALDDQEQPLPDLQEQDPLNCKNLDALGHETKPPARFTEASLVKLLEQEGIGRPSTYASIIDTVINRGYARKNGSQLVPTFTAFATNNLLEKQFAQLVDTGFTAQMEDVLDDIAAGDLEAEPYLERFYRGQEGLEARTQTSLAEVDAKAISTLHFPKWGDYLVRVGRFGPYAEGVIDGETVTTSLPADLPPDEITKEYLEKALTEGNAADNVVGAFPETGEVMILKSGPYGPYVQLGDDEQAGKPKRTSLPRGLEPSAVTQELAAGLLSLPRTLGQHPDTGKDVQAAIGRFGPYVKHGSTFASLPKEDDVLSVALPRALDLITKKEFKNKPLRVLGEHPETGEDVELRDGRYGPYVKHQKTNASLTTQEPDTVTLDEALGLLAERERTHPTKKVTGTKAAKKSTGKKKAAPKKAGAKTAKKSAAKKSAKKPAGPKATPRQLEPFLGDLDPEVAEVVVKLEGMRGERAQDIATVADSVGMSEEGVKAAHKRGMFKLRMAFGRARKDAENAPVAA